MKVVAAIMSDRSSALISTIKLGSVIAPQNSVSTRKHSKLAGIFWRASIIKKWVPMWVLFSF